MFVECLLCGRRWSRRLGCIPEQNKKIPALVGLTFPRREAEYGQHKGTGSTAVWEPGAVSGMPGAGPGAVAQGGLLTEMQPA